MIIGDARFTGDNRFTGETRLTVFLEGETRIFLTVFFLVGDARFLLGDERFLVGDERFFLGAEEMVKDSTLGRPRRRRIARLELIFFSLI